MRRLLVFPLALLFIALSAPSNAQNADVTVEEGAPLTVECALRVDERAAWLLDGSAPPADLRPAGEAAAGGRLTARLHAAAARPQHGGVYTCARPPAARVRVLVRPAAAVLPVASAESATPADAGADAGAGAGPKGGAAAPALTLTYYEVGRSFSLNCSVPRTAGAGDIVWRKNGTVIEKVWELNDRYTLDNNGALFSIPKRTYEDDFGNYTCAVGGEAPAMGWELRGRPYAKLPPDTNVVEGQKLKLLCKVVGKPYPGVTWTVANSTEDNATSVLAVLGSRAVLARSEQGVADAELVLDAAARYDAGRYTCAPAGGTPAVTTLRVKDMYAALWPFLGICAEVFVLCAIILVYEKRRTKPELDDSDTDNHDQKKS